MSKVDNVIRLPLTMDMTPYTAAHLSADADAGVAFDPVLDSSPMYHYALYAVVNHEGMRCGAMELCELQHSRVSVTVP
jgi:hypothetical protein